MYSSVLVALDRSADCLAWFFDDFFLHDLLPHRVRVFAYARVGVVREVSLLGNSVVLYQ